MLKRLRDRLREIKLAEFRRMELAATKVTVDLLGEFRANFDGTLRSIDHLMAHPDCWNGMWRRQLFRLAHDLRGLGGTFNYGLITTIGESLCDLIKNDDLPNDNLLQRHVLAHVAALEAIRQFDLKGDGGSQGKELLVTLRIEKVKHRTK
jgi:hypothetical protein